MTTFDERERGFEAKFAHDQDLQFRLTARRDKLFAAWAAAELGLTVADSVAMLQAVLQVPDGLDHDERLKDFMITRFPARPDFPMRTWLGVNLATCAIQAHADVIEALA